MTLLTLSPWSNQTRSIMEDEAQLLINEPLRAIQDIINLGYDDRRNFEETYFNILQGVLSKYNNIANSRLTCNIRTIQHIRDLEEVVPGTIVKMTLMIQNDSQSNQYFIPFGREPNGTLVNCGMFYEHILEASVEQSIVETAPLASRRTIIAAEAPFKGIIPPEHLLLLNYDVDVNISVNQMYDIIGIYQDSIDRDTDYPYNLPSLHVLNICGQSLNHPPTMDLSLTRDSLLNTLSTIGFRGRDPLKVLLALISRVSNRQNGIVSSLLIGNYPLNVQVEKTDNSNIIIDVLTALNQKSLVIKLSSDILDSTDFTSRMDYDTGRLVGGLLQVPPGTLIIVDERCLQVGKLSEMAARNMQSLLDLINHQSVSYDFGGQQIPMNSSVCFISISHGKSILPIENIAQFILDKEEMVLRDEYQSYLDSARSFKVSDCSDEIESKIDRILCEFCNSDPNHLSKVLNSAHLIAASYNSTTIQYSHLTQALSLF